MNFKLIFTTIILFTSIHCFCQSKGETIKWLNAKFENVANYDVAGEPGFNYLQRFLKINQDGSYLINCKYYRDLDENPIDSFIIRGLLKDLNPEAITISKSISYSFKVICTNSKKCVTSKFKDKRGRLNISTDSNIEFGPIFINDDPDLEIRIINALQHLIKLFGGKKDTF
jgi:hypothetical protein